MRDKRLLILGSLEDLVKLTKLAVSKGIYTVVMDGYEGEAKKYATKAYTVHLSDEDLVDQVIKEEKIDYVISSFSDLLFETAIKTANRNGLPCFCDPDKMRCLRDKILMKKMLEETGIASSKSQTLSLEEGAELSEEDIHIKFPCVAKPQDGWGSKGLGIVHNMDELKSHINANKSFATDGYSMMLEEINFGYELNVMTWIKEGQAYLVEFGDRETSEMTRDSLPHQSREIFPSFYYKELEETIKDYALRIADYCGIKEGPLSLQLFYEDGKLTVGEAAGRFFGYGQGIVPIINGIDPNELLINMAFDPEANHTILERTKTEYAFDHCSIALYLLPKRGVVRDIGNLLDFKNEHTDEFKVYVEPGVSTTHTPWIVRIYAHFETREQADEYTDNIYKNLYVPGLNGENLVRNNFLVSYDGKKWKNM